MLKIIKVGVLSFFLIASVQADEFKEKVWYCTDVASAGLSYKKNDWKKVSFKNNRYTIKQTGEYELIIPEDIIYGYTCRKGGYTTNFISCSDASSMFALNTNTGLAAYSYIGGWLYSGTPSPDEADSLIATALKCETF